MKGENLNNGVILSFTNSEKKIRKSYTISTDPYFFSHLYEAIACKGIRTKGR
jgi:hypothetical protein